MKKYLSILLILLILTSVSLNAQRNYGQELVNLLYEGKCFEAREFYKLYKDSIPKDANLKGFVDTYYKYKMSSFFNKPDSTFFYLQNLISNYKNNLGGAVIYNYNEMLGILNEQQKYYKAISLLGEITTYVKKDTVFSKNDSNFIQTQLDNLEKIKKSFIDKEKNEPKIKIVREISSKKQRIKLYNDTSFVYFDAEYNGLNKIKTLFDTGVTYYFVIEKTIADSLNVKYLPSKDSLVMLNGVSYRAIRGIFDFVKIGCVNLYNVPVLVLLDGYTGMIKDSLKYFPEGKRKTVERMFNDHPIIIGLSTMLLIGQFEFDWKKMTLFISNKSKLTNKEPNICIKDMRLFTNVNINHINSNVFIDTGADKFMEIDSAFYEKNKNIIQIDTIIKKEPYNYGLLTGIYHDIPYEYISKDMEIYFEDKGIPYFPKDVRIILRTNFSKTPSCFVGIYFFRRLGRKTLLDFNNMRLEGTGKLKKI